MYKIRKDENTNTSSGDPVRHGGVDKIPFYTLKNGDPFLFCDCADLATARSGPFRSLSSVQFHAQSPNRPLGAALGSLVRTHVWLALAPAQELNGFVGNWSFAEGLDGMTTDKA